MKRASELFDESQRNQIEQAVVAAEAKTSCEIVPVVASASGRYDRPEDMVGLWLAVIAATIVWLFFPRPLSESGSWSDMPMFVGLLTMVIAVVVTFVVGAFVASRIDWLRRLFSPNLQMEDEVAARARQVFFDKRVHHTTGSTGVLIYVSLFERKAAVLSDHQVLEKMGQAFLDQLCQSLTDDLRKTNSTEAICRAIAEAGNGLAIPIPREEGDVNECQDALILID